MYKSRLKGVINLNPLQIVHDKIVLDSSFHRSQDTSQEVRQALIRELPFEHQREFYFGCMIPFCIELVDPIIAM